MRYAPAVAGFKGRSLPARCAGLRYTSCVAVSLRPAQRFVLVRWTRKEYEESEIVKEYFARNTRKRRLPAEDEVDHQVSTGV